MLAIVAGFALLIGLLLGVFGGGGSIMAVPVLVHVAGLGGKEAIALSLLVVGATAAIGALRHARVGNVDWRAGAMFAPFAMVGAFGGGLVAQFIPAAVLLGLFAAMMVLTAVAMLRPKRADSTDDDDEATGGARASLWLIAVEGLAIGGFTGLVGAGGGFLVVPALVVLGGLSMHRAVGTSLVVIAAKSLTGFLGYVSHVQVDYVLAGIMVATAVVGTLVGASLARRIDAALLRRAFAYFVLVMGVYMLTQPLGWAVYTIIICAAAAVVVAWGVTRAASKSRLALTHSM